MFALAVTVAIRTGAPTHVPSWALRSSLVYSLELVFATVGVLYALLTVAIHGVLARGDSNDDLQGGLHLGAGAHEGNRGRDRDPSEAGREPGSGLDYAHRSSRPRSGEAELRSRRNGIPPQAPRPEHDESGRGTDMPAGRPCRGSTPRSAARVSGLPCGAGRRAGRRTCSAARARPPVPVHVVGPPERPCPYSARWTRPRESLV